MELEGLTRRDFVIYSWILPAALLSNAEAQSSPRSAFVRGRPLNSNSLPWIEPDAFKENYVPTPEEGRLHLENIQKRYLLPKGALKSFESYQRTRFRAEPDKKYAEALIEEAAKSIDHMVGFLGNEYIRKPEIIFKVPESEKDLATASSPPIVIYLVSDLERLKIVRYQIEGEKAIFNSILTTDLYGSSFQNFQIFYDTSSGIVGLVEAPAIEVLHRLTWEYGFKHSKDSISRNEKFVHALSILWIREYAEARGLLTNRELEERFALYEQRPEFKGTGQFASHMARIGVKRAIDMYVNDPDGLFAGAGLK